MRKFVNIVILLIFTIWIIPLGVFIKPEQEKKACDGKRAICLCRHLVAKKIAKMAGKQFLKAGGSPHKEQSNSSSSSPDFIFKVKSHDFRLAKNQNHQSATISTNYLFIRPIEHVPKV